MSPPHWGANPAKRPGSRPQFLLNGWPCLAPLAGPALTQATPPVAHPDHPMPPCISRLLRSLRRQRPAQRQAAGVAHEHHGGRGVEPQEAQAGADQRGGGIGCSLGGGGSGMALRIAA